MSQNMGKGYSNKRSHTHASLSSLGMDVCKRKCSAPLLRLPSEHACCCATNTAAVRSGERGTTLSGILCVPIEARHPRFCWQPSPPPPSPPPPSPHAALVRAM
jgi:hypothetical protein